MRFLNVHFRQIIDIEIISILPKQEYMCFNAITINVLANICLDRLYYIEIEKQIPYYTKNNKNAIYYKSSNLLSYTV